MSDLIYKDAAINKLLDEGLITAAVYVSEVPAVEVPDRKVGKWIYINGAFAFECSVCGGRMVRNVFKYCPWCGSHMSEEDGHADA